MKFEGITLELKPFPIDERIAGCCRNFVNEVGLTGPFHFELLYSAETSIFHYLEINPRLGGTTDKVFRLGFDEPLWTLAAYGFDIPVRQYHAPRGRSVINRRSVQLNPAPKVQKIPYILNKLQQELRPGF